MTGPAVHPTAAADTWRRPCTVCGHPSSWIADPDMCAVCYELDIDPAPAARIGRIVTELLGTTPRSITRATDNSKESTMATFILPEGVKFTTKVVAVDPATHQAGAPARWEYVELKAAVQLDGFMSVEEATRFAVAWNSSHETLAPLHITGLDVHNLPLSQGTGTPRNPCVIAKASMVYAANQGNVTPWVEFTDWPAWLNRVINNAGIQVNDNIGTTNRSVWDRLNATVPRVCAANRLDDAHTERRINARLLCWAVRHVWGDRIPANMVVAVAEREAWLEGRSTDAECLYWAQLVAKQFPHNHLAAACAGAATVNPQTISRTINEVLAPTGRGRQRDRVETRDHEAGVKFFELLLDQWEKACAEEGVLGDSHHRSY